MKEYDPLNIYVSKGILSKNPSQLNSKRPSEKGISKENHEKDFSMIKDNYMVQKSKEKVSSKTSLSSKKKLIQSPLKINITDWLKNKNL